MKAIICSTDGIPQDVAVVNDIDYSVVEGLRATEQWDRVDVVEVTPQFDLLAYARHEAQRLAKEMEE